MIESVFGFFYPEMSVLDGISIFWSILAVFYLALAINSGRLYLQTKRVGGVKIGKKGLLVGGSLDQEHSIITSQKVGIDIVNQEDLDQELLDIAAAFKHLAITDSVGFILAFIAALATSLLIK